MKTISWIHFIFAEYTSFNFFFNNVKNHCMFSYIQTRRTSIAGYYVVSMFSKYLSSEQVIKDRKDCA